MKIVNIEDFFHPETGYQINILSKYFANFGHDVTIVTSLMEKAPDYLSGFFGKEDIENKDKVFTKETGVKIIRLPTYCFLSSRAIFTRKLQETIKLLSPDILYVHGNDTFSGITFIVKAHKLPYALVSDSHMLEMASKNCSSRYFRKFYQLFVTPRIIKNNIPVIRTQNDPYVEKCLGIPLVQAPWISYGSDMLLFHPDEAIKKSFRAENGINDDDFVVVYTGKMDESKGGKLLAEAFRDKFNASRRVILIAVGNTYGEYGKEVEKIFLESKNLILRFPTQKYTALAMFYQAADISVFAKQCSLSFYDAQACGLPVISEDNKLNIDRCSHKNGWNFKAGDVKDFHLKIEAAACMESQEYCAISKQAYYFISANYDYREKALEYEAILKKTYGMYIGENAND